MKDASHLLRGCYSYSENAVTRRATLFPDNIGIVADYLDDHGEGGMAEGARYFAEKAEKHPDELFVVISTRCNGNVRDYLGLSIWRLDLPAQVEKKVMLYSEESSIDIKYAKVPGYVLFLCVEDAIWCFCLVWKEYKELALPSMYLGKAQNEGP